MSADQDASGSLYDTLGIGSDASDTEITRAYRRLAREHHPDTSSEDGGEAFSELTDAYDVLHDPTRRRAYDDARQGRARAATRAAAGIRIPVRHAPPEAPRPAGTRPPQTREERAPGPRQVELHLTFDQAALGTTAVLAVDRDEPCSACRGGGVALASDTTCASCDGAGATARRSGGINIRTECPACGGTGRAQPETCAACGGRGATHRTSDLAVRVPAGVDTGARLRIPLPGGGEIVGVIRAGEHPYFTRAGRDLQLHVPVTIAEASLGGVVTVPTLDSAVAIRLPPGTPHGRIMRVRGRGIPHGDGRGDLLVTIDVAIPSTLNDAQRAALEAFASATTDSPRRHLEDQDRRPGRDEPDG